jgi:transposase
MKELSLEIINPRAAGIDVGSRFHMVSVGQSKQDVKRFGVYTEDHERMAQWLKDKDIHTIAMESTGSYWQTLFDFLQASGFEVILVNGNQVKNVKGKKTDVLDCMWIQKLHSLGLLSGSFLPDHDLQKLRTYYTHRQYLVSQLSRYINKMQKALRLMNIRLDVVVNDIMGQSGRQIIESILEGERDSTKLSKLANYRIRASKDEISKSLEGNWRTDLLFELRESLILHDAYVKRIEVCDQELASNLKSVVERMPMPNGNISVKKKRPTKHSPEIDLEDIAYKYFRVDLFEVAGISHNTAY